jgi:hypothetical protein
MKVSSDGPEVGEYIIGDATNPLLPWLITPYQLEEDPSDYKAVFNRRHSETATTTLQALTRLKDTWKLLNGVGMGCPEHINIMHRIVHACCVLHNIVIDMEGELSSGSVVGALSATQASPGSIPQGANIKPSFLHSSMKNAEGSFPLWPRFFCNRHGGGCSHRRGDCPER